MTKINFWRFRHFVFSLLLFVISYPLFSQLQTYSDGKYTYQAVDGDPLKARIYKLDNGLTVYMTVYKDEPRIQTFIAVKTGSKKDPPDATGLAHYLEHMLFKGTDKFGTINYDKEKVYLDEITNLYELHRQTIDPAERKKIYHQIDSVSGLASQYAIANEYDKMMSSIGAKGTNAYTSNEQTVYTEDIPSNQIEKWLTVEAERFRHPVMRLFHTELEAVYEEKNISLDNDGSKLWEALGIGLYPTHPYGTQTTIGTIEHLKNPSIKKVIDYLNTYYVPNNIAICLSGDFDMDETIKLIDEKWGKLPSKDVPVWVSPIEAPITSPVVKEVIGPEEEQVYMGFRFPGSASDETKIVTMISRLLSNGTAGLIDINLNQKQKVLDAGSFLDDMKDYSSHILYGKPREGQSLEEVKDLLLSQIELIKNGDFPDWMLEAVINNMKLQQIKSFESNRRRAHAFVDAFILEEPWNEYIFNIRQLEKIMKQEIVDFAKANYSNNYVVVYKRTGEDKNVQKVEKPQITPVNVNRTEQSDFLKSIVSSSVPDIQPVFVDYSKDIKKASLKNGIPLYYKENTENNTFNLYYVLDRGTNNDKKLGLATSYLEYLGTSKYTPAQMKEEFYKLGCSFSVSSSSEQIYVSLSGLNENFEKGVDLFEELLSVVQPNQQALDNLVNDILKVRADDKLSQDKILWDAMLEYAMYGPKSPFTNILSKEELKSVKPEELTAIIKKMLSSQHIVLYYGPMGADRLIQALNAKHKVPGVLKSLPKEVLFPELPTNENKVYFVNYPGMVQAEIIFLSKGDNYNKDYAPVISMYNEYFGSGMAGIVFQELRESKALAYSTFSSYSTPSRKENAYYILSYIGTQSDKMSEAINGMKGILNDMPESDVLFNSSKNSLLQQIRTSRTTKTSVLFNYLSAQKMGLDYDIRKDVFEKVPALSFNDIKTFQENNIKDKNATILVLGDKDKLDMDLLKKYGNVKTLTLEEIFGY